MPDNPRDPMPMGLEPRRVTLGQPRRKSKRHWLWRRLPYVLLMSVPYGLLMFMLFRDRRLSFDPAYIGFLVIVPFAIGLLSAFTIHPEQRTWPTVMGLAVFTLITFFVIANAFISGILLCVVLAAPLWLVLALIGAGLVRLVTYLEKRGGKKKKRREYAFIGFVLLLPLLVAQVEAGVPLPEWYRSVEDEIVIRGSLEEIWQHIIRMDDIRPEEQRPSFYQVMGIPRPVRATLDFEGVGAMRRGEFEYGLSFNEAITVWEPQQAVRFSVSVEHNPQSTPVLMQIGGRYFDILEAGYHLEQLDSETVLLRLDSRYRLSTNFNFYGVFWSDWIMHDFQSYVLNTVKQRVESGRA